MIWIKNYKFFFFTIDEQIIELDYSEKKQKIKEYEIKINLRIQVKEYLDSSKQNSKKINYTWERYNN